MPGKTTPASTRILRVSSQVGVSVSEWSQLFICDDWGAPVKVIEETMFTAECPRQVAKNFLLVTIMSLNVGYGSLIEGHQREPEQVGLNPPALNSVFLSEEQAQRHYQMMDQEQRSESR